jgi:hypothetical protein
MVLSVLGFYSRVLTLKKEKTDRMTDRPVIQTAVPGRQVKAVCIMGAEGWPFLCPRDTVALNRHQITSKAVFARNLTYLNYA